MAWATFQKQFECQSDSISCKRRRIVGITLVIWLPLVLLVLTMIPPEEMIDRLIHVVL